MTPERRAALIDVLAHAQLLGWTVTADADLLDAVARRVERLDRMPRIAPPEPLGSTIPPSPIPPGS